MENLLCLAENEVRRYVHWHRTCSPAPAAVDAALQNLPDASSNPAAIWDENTSTYDKSLEYDDDGKMARSGSVNEELYDSGVPSDESARRRASTRLTAPRPRLPRRSPHCAVEGARGAGELQGPRPAREARPA